MKRYLSDFWNRWDILSHALLIVALFVRHFYIDETFTIARRMFALSLLVMYLRFLEVFLMFKKIGLTIIMIKEMVKLSDKCIWSYSQTNYFNQYKLCRIVNYLGKDIKMWFIIVYNLLNRYNFSNKFKTG